MPRCRVLPLLVVLAALIPAIAQAADAQAAGAQAAESRPPLSATLPADKTIAYVHLDMARFLDQVGKSLAFVDPTAAGKIEFELKDLYSMGQELAKAYEFKPALLEHLAEVDIYVTVLAKDKTEQIVHTVKIPKYNRETMEPVPGEFEEQSFTEVSSYTPSLVLRTPSEEMAADFVQQYRAMLDRQKEKHPDDASLERTEIQVEKGALVGLKDGSLTVGCLGDMVIVSGGNPKDLFAALIAPPDKKLVDSAAYQKLMAGAGGAPGFIGMVNLGELIHRSEAGLKDAVEAAKKAAGEEAGQDAQDPMAGMGSFQLQMTQVAYDAFMTFQKLFSLDKLEWAGVGLTVTADEKRMASTTYGMLSHGEPISPLLQELLSGSGSFQPPAIGKPDCMAVLVRVDAGRVVNDVIDAISAVELIGPPIKGELDAMRARLGVGLDDLLKLPASDFYVYIDFVEKDVDEVSRQFNMETQQWTEAKTTVHKVVSEVTAFCGLKDPNAARDAIGGLVTRLSTDPELNPFVKKRTYQETDVYCFGQGVTEPEVYPDGSSSFAVVIIGRYLTFGSWDDVTKAVRQLGSAASKTDPALMAVVQANPEANLLLVVPKAFQQNYQRLATKMEGGQEFFDFITSQLNEKDFGLEDKDLEQRIKTALGELVKAYRTLSEKTAEASPDQAVMKGAHNGNYYEIITKEEVTK